MVKYYFYFPEEDHEIVKSDVHLVTRVFEIAKLIKGEIYYDENNIEVYSKKSDILGIYLDNALKQLRYKFHKLGAKSIHSNPLLEKQSIYLQWNFDLAPMAIYCKPIIADLAERVFRSPNEKALLINLDDAITACRQNILVFKDAKHIPAMPSIFAKIDFVIDAKELEIWQSTHDNTSFTLLDRVRFKRTKMVYDGKPIFEEITTKKYWYMDNFHKNEYEVFDRNKEHIAVANLNGIEDPSQKVNGRKF